MDASCVTTRARQKLRCVRGKVLPVAVRHVPGPERHASIYHDLSIIGISRWHAPSPAPTHRRSMASDSQAGGTEQASKHVSSASRFIRPIRLDDPRHLVEGKSW
jgi:hypothetical protein